MKIAFSQKALRDYENLPRELRRIADKQFHFLLTNLRHPSLRSKKYDEARGIWQARLTRGWRFYFQIRNKAHHLLTIIKHPE